MPSRNDEVRLALMSEVYRRRESGATFEQIARDLRLRNRQAARLLYRAEAQRLIDQQALADASAGADVNPLADVSASMLIRLRREFPASLVSYEARRTMIRQRDDQQIESGGQIGRDASAFERLIGFER